MESFRFYDIRSGDSLQALYIIEQLSAWYLITEFKSSINSILKGLNLISSLSCSINYCEDKDETRCTQLIENNKFLCLTFIFMILLLWSFINSLLKTVISHNYLLGFFIQNDSEFIQSSTNRRNHYSEFLK